MTHRIKVLNINYDSSEYGGVPIFLINVHRNINLDKFQIDFLTADTTSYNPWREEIECAGGQIFEFHINCKSRKGKIRFGRHLRAFLEDQSYDIVHINCGSVLFDCIAALAVKSKKTKIIIHSHNSGERSWWKKPIFWLLKLIMQNKADVLCACSEKAARYVYTYRKINQGKVIIINNGIDLKKFQYNIETRQMFRKELGVEKQFVVGHIGRFVRQKNHDFLIDIFAEILKQEPDATLLLIGQGELEPLIRRKVHQLNIEDNIKYLGQRDDVEKLYQTMDIFLFPSLYEGLPITLVEAQMSGLPCCISDTITDEVDLTSLIHRVSLRATPQEWAKVALSISIDPCQRGSKEQELIKAGYGMKSTASILSQIYEGLVQAQD